jgi:hypothetical protein
MESKGILSDSPMGTRQQQLSLVSR